MLRKLIVSAGGLGLLRPAPGTWGSIPPCALAFVLILVGAPEWSIVVGLFVLLVASSAACVALGDWAERTFQGKDPGVVVVDEVAGMALTLLFVPLYPPAHSAADPWLFGFIVIGAAFLLFRILDIIKVPPANLVQQFPGGWGILLDDLVVGVYGNIILQLFLRGALPHLA
jgi:phosphatidylglycerophosphatase A